MRLSSPSFLSIVSIHQRRIISTVYNHLFHSSTSSLTQWIDIQLQESDLHESFIKGSGKGGQKINKVRNCVLLTHKPTGIQVRTQKTRSLDGNRRIARNLLMEKLDDYYNGLSSKRNQKIERLRRQKAHRRAKSTQKYVKTHSQEKRKRETQEEDEDETETDDDEDETEDNEEVVAFWSSIDEKN